MAGFLLKDLEYLSVLGKFIFEQRFIHRISRLLFFTFVTKFVNLLIFYTKFSNFYIK